MKNKRIIAKIDISKPLSSKAFMNLMLAGWAIAMIALLVVSYWAEKDIAGQIERSDMENGPVIEDR